MFKNTACMYFYVITDILHEIEWWQVLPCHRCCSCCKCSPCSSLCLHLHLRRCRRSWNFLPLTTPPPPELFPLEYGFPSSEASQLTLNRLVQSVTTVAAARAVSPPPPLLLHSSRRLVILLVASLLLQAPLSPPCLHIPICKTMPPWLPMAGLGWCQWISGSMGMTA